MSGGEKKKRDRPRGEEGAREWRAFGRLWARAFRRAAHRHPDLHGPLSEAGVQGVEGRGLARREGPMGGAASIRWPVSLTPLTARARSLAKRTHGGGMGGGLAGCGPGPGVRGGRGVCVCERVRGGGGRHAPSEGVRAGRGGRHLPPPANNQQPRGARTVPLHTRARTHPSHMHAPGHTRARAHSRGPSPPRTRPRTHNPKPYNPLSLKKEKEKKMGFFEGGTRRRIHTTPHTRHAAALTPHTPLK